MRKLTVTIGVAAYNEEGNIARLLDSIIIQNKEQFDLKNIIVISDGSTDKTGEIVTKYRKIYKDIQLVHDGKRKGKPARLNYLFKNNTSDILVCLDADVRLGNKHVLNEIASIFRKNPQIQLVGGNDIPDKPRNFFESVNDSWILYWQQTRRPLDNWVNPTNNPGRLYAVRHAFAKKIRIPKEITADDHFVFFACMELGHTFKFCPKAIVYFKAPKNFSDFLRQSHRFGTTGLILSHTFHLKRKYHEISLAKEIKMLIRQAFIDPIRFPLAILLQITVKLYSRLSKESFANGIYNPVTSSK